MNNLINQLRAKVKQLAVGDPNIPYQELCDLHSNITKLLFEISEHNKKLALKASEKRMAELLHETKYVEPIYPSVSYEEDEALESEPGSCGHCVFSSEQQAKELISKLVNQSYYYGHDLKWHGVGRYLISPSWKHDHDSEVIYTATYTKMGDL